MLMYLIGKCCAFSLEMLPLARVLDVAFQMRGWAMAAKAGGCGLQLSLSISVAAIALLCGAGAAAGGALEGGLADADAGAQPPDAGGRAAVHPGGGQNPA